MNIIEFIRQISILLTLPAVVLTGIMAAVLVIWRDWRLALLAYAIQSATLALLLTQKLPVQWALLQAIVGGLIGVMVFLSARQLRGAAWSGSSREARWPQLASTGLFRILAVLLTLLAFLAVRNAVQMPVLSPVMRDGVLWLMMAGFLGLALHEEPLHAGLALLTLLGGFVLLMFNLTQNRTLLGLMEGWQLLLGLAISYLTVSRGLAHPADVNELAPFRWRP
jgi:hypothetical protein